MVNRRMLVALSVPLLISLLVALPVAASVSAKNDGKRVAASSDRPGNPGRATTTGIRGRDPATLPGKGNAAKRAEAPEPPSDDSVLALPPAPAEPSVPQTDDVDQPDPPGVGDDAQPSAGDHEPLSPVEDNDPTPPADDGHQPPPADDDDVPPPPPIEPEPIRDPDDRDYGGLVMHAVRADTPRGAYDAAAANRDVAAYPGAAVNPSFWNFHGGGTPAVIEDNPFGDGGRVLRIVTPSQGPLSNPDKSRLVNQPTLIGNYILNRDHPVLNLEYDIRFGTGYHLTSPWGPQGGNTVAYGGKLPGLGGTADDGLPPVSCGAAGDINNGFSARTMWRNDAQLSSYLYWRDKTSSCGHNYAFGPTLTPDRWYTVRQRITMNTPGQADGRVERWVNGVKQEDVHGFRFRAADQTFGVNRVIMQFYHGGNTWDWGHPGGAPGSPANHIYFRDFRAWTGQ